MQWNAFFSYLNHLPFFLMASGFVILSPSPSASGQTASTDSKTMLDPAPWVSPRASGMGGALSTAADNMDGFYYNPATIGGQTYGGKPEKEPFVRQVLFPRGGLTLNEDAMKLNNEFSANGSKTDATTGAATIKAHEGKRQYARASLSPVGLFLGGIGVVPIVDQQIAAIPQNTDNSDVEFRYRTFSGLVVGSSITDPKGFLSLGASSTIGTIEETYATSPYVDMVDVEKRADILAANKKTYTASALNVGALVRVPNKANPTISLVSRDLGTTKNPNNAGGDPLITQEDVTAGFGISPAFVKWARLNLSLESGYLTDKHRAAGKKLRAGAEMTFGQKSGSRSLFGIRVGGTSAGASYGMHLNIGLIGLEASSHAVDIGINNERLIERRNSAVAYIDVASF